MKLTYTIFAFLLTLQSCSKSETEHANNGPSMQVESVSMNGKEMKNNVKGIPLDAEWTLQLHQSSDPSQLASLIRLRDSSKANVSIRVTGNAEKNQIHIRATQSLSPLTDYRIEIDGSPNNLVSDQPLEAYRFYFTTAIDSTDKQVRLSDESALLDLVQRQTFAYFWDFAHPSSGMIPERSGSQQTVTTGGTGFGLMAIVVGVHRGFITRSEGLQRTQKIVAFLSQADRYHGAFSHWYDGATGSTLPFSEQDDGGDLVETALLVQGLLAAREYYEDPSLSSSIDLLIEEVEWSHFQNQQEVLFWHWSPNHNWALDLKIEGWNESLIAYVLAAGSPTYSITRETYQKGWARDGDFRNGKSFYNLPLPLGPDYGGPLFTAQYSFLGLDPNGLRDEYADYGEQTKNQTLINRAYCVDNPLGYYGYSEDVWGLTAGDIPTGYGALSPTNDLGVISPTAALSSMPYTPQESLDALTFFYYKLGDRIWGEYGFKDGFSLDQGWFADSYLAINQGPIIIGIENHRSGLIWDLVMRAPEIQTGLRKLGFSSSKI